jgi:UDP-glucose:(heptosyl)LPS alpha-1,3-glucosyltransferase
VVLEALACGLPAVTTAANGAAEFITPGENGAVAPRPDDIAGLTEALAAFLARDRDPQLRLAAAQAVAGLSWESTVAQTLEVLKEAGS